MIEMSVPNGDVLRLRQLFSKDWVDPPWYKKVLPESQHKASISSFMREHQKQYWSGGSMRANVNDYRAEAITETPIRYGNIFGVPTLCEFNATWGVVPIPGNCIVRNARTIVGEQRRAAIWVVYSVELLQVKDMSLALHGGYQDKNGFVHEYHPSEMYLSQYYDGPICNRPVIGTIFGDQSDKATLYTSLLGLCEYDGKIA
jgi:hypothetical protein